MKKKVAVYVAVGIGVIVVALALYFILASNKAGNSNLKLDSFAKCLNQSGAKMYGAFWCPHCQSQKQLFGSSVEYLPYVECSSPNGQSQLPVCAQENITGYPTWIFSDGTRQPGELSLQALSEKTGCALLQ
jgi:hypothetical protein